MKDQLQTLRKAKGLTQEEAATIFEVKLTTYQKYERDVISPSYDTLCKIADFYGVTTDYLLGRSEDAGTLLDRVQTDEELPFEARVLAAAYLSLGKADRERLMAMVREQREKLFEDEDDRIEVPTGDLPDPQKDSETSSSA